MAYIGSSAALIPVAFSAVNSQAFNGDDSSVSFTLNRAVLTKQLEVIVNNVQQSPYDGSYAVSSTTLTFSEAPSTGTANIYVNYRDQSVGTIIDETAYRKGEVDSLLGTIDLSSRVAKTGDTMSGTLIINGELFVNSNEINLDDLQSLSWGDGSVQVRGNGTAETLELRTSAATRLYITPTGDIGMGTPTPERTLDVVGHISNRGLYFNPNTIDSDVLIDSDRNAMMVGPVTINSTITINGTFTVV